MVVLWMGGKQIDTVADADLLARLRAMPGRVELRDESGKPIGEYTPSGGPPIPWEPETTMEDIKKRMAEPGLTYEEVKKRLGWE